MGFFWFLARGYVVTVGLAYPALLMVNAIETNSAALLTKCVAHFVVMAAFSVAELAADLLFFWLPLVDLVKVAVVTALVAQDLSGASWVYNVLISPRLTRHARDIDEVVALGKAYAALLASYILNVFASIVGMMTGSGAAPIIPPAAVAAVASGTDLAKGAAGSPMQARPGTPPLAGGGFVEVFQTAEQLRVRSAAQRPPPQLPPRLNTAAAQARPLSTVINEAMVAETPAPTPTSTLFSRLLAMVSPTPSAAPKAPSVPPTPVTPMMPKAP